MPHDLVTPFSLRTIVRNNIRAILWGIFIFLLTSLPGDLIPAIPKFIDLFKPDKLVHVFIFLVFVFFLLQGFERKDNPAIVQHHPLALGLTIAISIGGLTEILQGWVIPMRVASPYDFIANVLGCFLGWGVYSFFKKKREKLKH